MSLVHRCQNLYVPHTSHMERVVFFEMSAAGVLRAVVEPPARHRWSSLLLHQLPPSLHNKMMMHRF